MGNTFSLQNSLGKPQVRKSLQTPRCRVKVKSLNHYAMKMHGEWMYRLTFSWPEPVGSRYTNWATAIHTTRCGVNKIKIDSREMVFERMYPIQHDQDWVRCQGFVNKGISEPQMICAFRKIHSTSRIIRYRSDGRFWPVISVAQWSDASRRA
jgi:hypothetical protein